jgi:hypothetical protein
MSTRKGLLVLFGTLAVLAVLICQSRRNSQSTDESAATVWYSADSSIVLHIDSLMHHAEEVVSDSSTTAADYYVALPLDQDGDLKLNFDDYAAINWVIRAWNDRLGPPLTVWRPWYGDDGQWCGVIFDRRE